MRKHRLFWVLAAMPWLCFADEPSQTQGPDSATFTKSVQPFLLKTVKTTQEHLDELYEKALREMMRDDFRADTKLLTVWGVSQNS